MGKSKYETSQSQPLRVESPDYASFCTSKTINSALWFVNNENYENHTLGYLAKYQQKYEIDMYGFVFSGSHYHLLSEFPNCNRSLFFRDLNARIAEGARNHVQEFPGGPLFGRRFSAEFVPKEDIEEQFFYCALQPVLAGLCEQVSDYPGYNSFFDAISGIEKEFKVIDWNEYNSRKRFNENVSIDEFTTVYKLKYKRLPGYEHISQEDYKALMLEKLEKRRLEIVKRFKESGKKFVGKYKLKNVIPGSFAKNPKTSTRHEKRPLILTKCAQAKKVFLEWYFSIYERYKAACKKYLLGATNVNFPPGTYKPPGPFVPILA